MHDDANVEPIVPIGKLIKELGCKFEWRGENCRLRHPLKGDIKVVVEDQCPLISSKEAHELIYELDQSKSLSALRQSLMRDNSLEMDWLEKLVATHPTLAQLPERVKAKLENLNLLGVNRRIRKRWMREGVILHLYAGPDEGYTLKRAVKEAGGARCRSLTDSAISAERLQVLLKESSTRRRLPCNPA